MFSTYSTHNCLSQSLANRWTETGLVKMDMKPYIQRRNGVLPRRESLHGPRKYSRSCGRSRRSTTSTTKLPMIPPFKLLLHHRHDIENTLKELKKQADVACEQSHLPPTAESKAIAILPDGSSSNPPSPVTHDKTTPPISRIERLQCIHNLIHIDLVNYVGLDVKARDGSLGEVLFSEVYQLYKPGDLIVSAELGDTQLYQVYSVTGGRIRRSLPPARTSREMHPVLQVGATIGTWTAWYVIIPS